MFKNIIFMMLLCGIGYAKKRCVRPEMVNRSVEGWTSQDRSQMERSKARCEYKYPKSPCLVKFIKMDVRTYHVVCGAKR